jgi:hypothetical protein
LARASREFDLRAPQFESFHAGKSAKHLERGLVDGQKADTYVPYELYGDRGGFRAHPSRVPAHLVGLWDRYPFSLEYPPGCCLVAVEDGYEEIARSERNGSDPLDVKRFSPRPFQAHPVRIVGPWP